ncbi:MAG: hypothetical protein MI864_03260 [Pseudomonadales bacterium]|nr:hypothetical protein [Pseudomonadales bacterium]
MTTPSPISAQKLLDMHVKHEVEALSSEQFVQDMEAEINAIFQLLPEVTLSEVISSENIMGIIQRNVIDLEIHGGISELIGEAANRIYQSDSEDDTLLKELMCSRQAEEFVKKALELQDLREFIIKRALANPIYSELVSNILYNGITNYIYEDNIITKKVPGVSPMMKLGKKMVNKAAPKLEGKVEENLKKYIAKNIQYIIRQSERFLLEELTPEQLREIAMDTWSKLEDKPVRDYQKFLGSLDLIEFVVMGYEYWLGLRKTDYIYRCCKVVVDYLFEKYGDEPLSVLVEDMGVNSQMVVTEVKAVAPGIQKMLTEKGFIEARIRNRLEKFYLSDSVVGLLG